MHLFKLFIVFARMFGVAFLGVQSWGYSIHKIYEISFRSLREDLVEGLVDVLAGG